MTLLASVRQDLDFFLTNFTHLQIAFILSHNEEGKEEFNVFLRTSHYFLNVVKLQINFPIMITLKEVEGRGKKHSCE